MPVLSSHSRWFLITIIGALIMTPDALLLRLINTDIWTMAFWRGILMPIGTLVFLIAYYRRDCLKVILGIGRQGLILALVQMIGTIAFITAITYTSAAKALIMVACSPMFAAVFSVVFLKEHLHRTTWLVVATTFIGMCIVVSDHLGGASGTLLGDVAGLLAAICFASGFTLMRYSKATNMVPATAIGWLMGAVLVFPLASPLSLTGTQIPLMALLGLVVLPIAFCLISLGPRYIPAPEVSLIMLLEPVLGSAWVWWILDEVPNNRTLTGGSIVVLSISLYSVWRLWKSKQASYRTNINMANTRKNPSNLP